MASAADIVAGVQGEKENKTMADMTPQEMVDVAHDKVNWFIGFLPQLAVAVLTLLFGLIFINCFVRCMHRRLASARIPVIQENEKDESAEVSLLSDDEEEPLKTKKVDPTILGFFMSALSVGLKCLLLMVFLSMLGIQTTSFVAILGAGSLVIGLSVQGLLEDVAKGIVFIMLQPFKVGDIIKVDDIEGKVMNIMLFATLLQSPDNQQHIVPNSKVGVISNLTSMGTVRIDQIFKISNDEDYKRAKDVLLRATMGEKMCYKKIPPVVLVGDITPEGTELVVRAWVLSQDLLDWPYVIREAGKEAFGREKIKCPRNIWMDPR